MDALRLGVVGVGHLGQHHARILAGMAGVKLVGVADCRPDQCRSVAERLGVPGYSDCRRLLGRVDAVTVAVPTTLHFAVGGEFLRRGIPAFIEKPLAADAAEGAALVRLAEDAGCVLQVGHVEQFNPGVLSAAALAVNPRYVAAERVGPYSFRSTDIGAVLDLMIHDLDLVLRWVRAPVERVAAIGATAIGPHEDMASARLEFADGTVADLHASRIALDARRRIQVWGDAGYVEIDCMQRMARRMHVGEHLDVEQLAAPALDPLTAELEEFVACVRDGHRPTVDGRRALAALQVAEQIIACVRRRSWDMGRAAALPPIIPGPHWAAKPSAGVERREPPASLAG